MPLLDSPQVTRVTRSLTRRNSSIVEAPKLLDEKPKRARKQIIIIRDSDSDDEEIEKKNAYRNKNVSVNSDTPQKGGLVDKIDKNKLDDIKVEKNKRISTLEKNTNTPKQTKQKVVLIHNSDSDEEEIQETKTNKGSSVVLLNNIEIKKIDELNFNKNKEIRMLGRNTPKKAASGNTVDEVVENVKLLKNNKINLKADNVNNADSQRDLKLKSNDVDTTTKLDAERDFKLREIQNTVQQSSPKKLNQNSPKSNTTPRKKKLDVENIEAVTPPKQQKTADVENKLFSPTSLFSKLDLNASPSKDNGAHFEPKKLFQEQPKSSFQNARKALHSTVPVQMPGREKEHEELREFIKGHLDNKTSGTLYVSGPPGTGKTASLSTILQQPDIESEFREVYVNCTAIKSSGAIYSRIVKELELKCSGKNEKDFVCAIENHLRKKHKMILLVLDEIDQLESKKQSVLYTIFEWPSWPGSRLILIGIANALDLTDRILPRLQARCELKPKLMHFAPYTKQQIVTIFTDRLKEAGVLDMFQPVALQMLAGKVAAISGDVRRALDIGRRVIEIAEHQKKTEAKSVDLKQVVHVLNSVYGTSNNLDDDEDSFPLQQKIIICTLLLILKKARNKDVTVGKLHEVYKKVCSKRNLLAVDQAEFAGLCSLIETKGIIRVSGRKEPRLHKVNLEWDDEEVGAALKDKQLMSMILQDDSVLGKM